MKEKIEKYLERYEKGVYVEAGAHNGIFESNTKWLEDKGWYGLLVEPNYDFFIQCVKNRPNSICENYALVSEFYDKNKIPADPGMGDNMKGLEIEVKTLTELLEKHDIYKIEIIFLDVEGHEINVLNGINFDKFDIELFVIECNVISEHKGLIGSFTQDNLTEFMNKKGYELIDELTINKDILYKKIKK